MTDVTAETYDAQLETWVASCRNDPLKFVLGAFPWGQKGTALEKETGPDDNQRQWLIDLGREITANGFDGSTPVMPIRFSESSGHDTGKTAKCGWITCFILSTRPHSDGTITAGGYAQLESRTWPAIQFWMGLCLTAPWFDVMETGIYAKGVDALGVPLSATWKVQMQSCKKQNAQAFAGQHAKRSTSWYWFDEASEVDDAVWVVAYNGLLDGEPMMFALGQMVRNTGEFHNVCFGKGAARWNHRRVDSRTSRFPNPAMIAQQIEDYGIDSDFVRVRILGYPPNADELQYIDKGRIDQARARTLVPLQDDPLVAGFDVSGGGKAWNVIRFRRGLCGNPLGSDGKPLLAIRIPGEKDPDRSQRIALCAELLTDRRPGHHLAALFIDSAFGAAIASRLHALGHTNVHEISFGGDSPDPHDANQRAFMYRKAKEHCLLGSLPDDDHVCGQLALPGYHINTSGKLVIESKAEMAARGVASPDDADAFVLTFARSVAIPQKAAAPPPPAPRSTWG
jgi:hypothetical protein